MLITDSLAGNEADEFRNAFLHCVFCILRNLAIGRQSLLHDAADVGDREEAVLLAEIGVRTVFAALMAASAAATWTRQSIGGGEQREEKTR